MKYTSPIISAASGSLAGNTFSRNKFGQYIRSRAVPVNPGTPFQTAIRSALASLSNLWGSTLTAPQREAWDTYAANVTVLDPLGAPINLTGFNHYIRSNTPRLQAGLARIDDGPTVFDLGTFTSPTGFNGTAATDEFSFNFTNADAWANATGAAMLVFSGRQQQATINYFKGPYRFAQSILGDDTTPPTSPVVISSPFLMDIGNFTFTRVRVSQADGRLSPDFRSRVLIGT